MPNITKTTLPATSLFYGQSKQYHYQDSFQAIISDPDNCLTPADAGKSFFTSAPAWVEALMGIRNRIAALVGLNVPKSLKNREKLLADFTCQPGEQLALFKVFAATDTEVVMGEDNKHLDFRISVMLEPTLTDATHKVLTLTTLVKFNNAFGRLYFLPVKPMHLIIVPVMLKGMVRELEKVKANKARNLV